MILNKVYLSLGTNLGNRFSNLEKAIPLINEQIGKILLTSRIYKTDPWGKTDQPEFLNQALFVETKLSPQELLKRLNEIENKAGRVRYEKWGERILDIDILFFNEQIINTENLIIPHTNIQNRKFVLLPLSEISNGFVHPLLKKEISELLEECTDNLSVNIVDKKLIKN
ncbi:MAG: 2-amino-4-hydroxy-6-hydroxymethyldihydropteridine diphosphokinase [Bacteroidota bacterium]|nr:2-amino-4-hydroxy-6-hydroxymethyldihydropteridine diphosphokinase [Bacteroidota bacterium]